jgi:hypothetical protein
MTQNQEIKPLRTRLDDFLDAKQRTITWVAKDAQLNYEALRKYRSRRAKGTTDFRVKLNKYLKNWGY